MSIKPSNDESRLRPGQITRQKYVLILEIMSLANASLTRSGGWSGRGRDPGLEVDAMETLNVTSSKGPAGNDMECLFNYRCLVSVNPTSTAGAAKDTSETLSKIHEKVYCLIYMR